MTGGQNEEKWRWSRKGGGMEVKWEVGTGKHRHKGGGRRRMGDQKEKEIRR